MRQLAKWLPLIILGVLVMAACGGDEPEVERNEFEVADPITEIDFSAADDIEIGGFDDGSSLLVRDGQYLVSTTSTEGSRYLYGTLNDQYPELKNVVIEVETTPQAGDENNWFGVMCRVDEEGTGYAFLISADGFWGISRTDGRSLEFLENWRETDAIRTGRETNHIRAYCVGDYLALYVNDEFVGDHTDSRIDDIGRVALMAGGVRDNRITVAFDNLVIQPANRKGQPNTATPAPVEEASPEPQTTLDVPSLE